MTELRQPENWKNRTAVLTLAYLMLAGAGFYCVISTVNALDRDDRVFAAIMAGFAVTIWGWLLGSVLGAMGTTRLRGSSTAAGTTLWTNPVGRWCLGVGTVGLLLTGVLYLLAARDRNDLPFMNPEDPGDATITMLILLIITVIGGGVYLLKGQTPVVRLGPDGVTHAHGSGSHTESWEDIVDVTDTSPNRNSRHPICLVREDDRPVVIENAGAYSPSGAALYWMVRHYWLHPENRGELTDGRALERLRDLDYAPE